MTPAQVVARADALKASRANFEAHWQAVADLIDPSREFTRKSSPGAPRQRMIYNTTPVVAAEQLAGGLHGLLTSPALRWFKLKGAGAGQVGHNGGPAMEDDEAADWFDQATDAMYSTFNSPVAGFNTAAHELYSDIAGFGNGPMFIGDAGRKGVVFHAVPLAECYVQCDGRGRVEGLFRQYELKARQIVAEWPEVQHKGVRQAAEKGEERGWRIIHAVTPKGEERGDWSHTSVYVLADGLEQLERGGFLEFPYVFARWQRRSGEDYGTGPGMKALPDIRLLNKLEELELRGLAKVIDPPLMAPDDGFLAPVTTQPGGVNYYRKGEVGENDRIYPLVTGARPEVAAEKIANVEARVERLFYTTWMNLPTRPNMTATEVLQRRDEQLRLLGPMVARLQQEFLGPLIERTFAILWRNGRLPPPPEALSGAGFEVEYLSPLALSQRASDADAVLRWWNAVATMAQLDPAAMDVADTGKTARFLADRYGAPASVLRSEDEATEIAQGRAEAQAQAQQLEAAQGIAGAAKDGAGALTQLQGMGQQEAVA